MARPREGSVTWNKKRKAWIARLDWMDETGKKRCRKRQVENRSAGKVLVKKWLREIEDHGAAYLDAERLTFKELAAEFERVKLIEPEYRDGRKVKGLRSWRKLRNRLVYLVEYFGARRIRAITHADIEEYRNRRLATPTKWTQGERSIADVQRGLSLLHSVFRFAVQKEWLARDPFTKGDSLISAALEKPRDRVYSTDEQRAILQACKANSHRKHLYPIVLVALDSGCRSGELRLLKWRDVDLEAGTLTILALNAKSNRERTITLEPITIEELRRLAKASGGFADELVFGIKSNFDGAWQSAITDAGLENAHFHDLRATAITTWLLRGLPMPLCMARSGHSSPAIFMRYVRLCEEIQKKQREQLREWDLAASLVELAGDIEPEKPELVN